MIKKLYDLFQPHHYNLRIHIDAANSEFSGSVEITGSLTKDSNFVELHAKELHILAAKINGVETTDITEAKDDVLVITLSDVIKAGSTTVTLEFKGTITDAMHGMYPCYFDHEGKRKKLIATQFESHHAREAFPCIDEPAAKATFDLELTTKEGEAVLANMPIKHQSTETDRVITQFETTPKMSTYLLAFVTGEMVVKEARTKDGVIVRSWASKAQDSAWLDYSVKETVDLIEFYNDYFGIPYPLPKCDQVALPDFEAGAMENWGLITYRETVFLSDPNNVSLSTQQYISLVVAHELSHQWFGNLVTMKWWDDLWLNESFANMTEYLAVDRLHPEWQMWEEFVAQDAMAATNRDVYSDVQSVRVTVNDPAEINTLFDPSIVYAKGGKLLKMLHDLLGDDAWRAGLKDYFETHKYGNTERDDLWAALGKHTNLDLAALMNSWIERPGQPLVTVDQQGKTLKLSQERLLLDGSSDPEVQWQVPLLSAGIPQLLTHKTDSLSIDDERWVRLNTSGVGHYVVHYLQQAHKDYLASKLGESTIESTWKIARLNELTMLAKHGDSSLAEALRAIQSSGNEQRAMVWSLIAGVISNARMLTEGNETAETTLKQLSADLARSNFEALGWEYPDQEDSNQTHLRTVSLSLMAASEDQTVIDHALKLYHGAKNPEQLPAEIRSIILGLVAKFGTNDEFNTLVDIYKSVQNAEFKVDLSAALASTRDPERAKTLLVMMLDTKAVRSQDLRHWYVYMLRNRYNRTATWQWLQINWPWIMENFGGSKSYDDFARYSASFLNTAEQLKEYKTFFEPMKTDPALKRAIAIGIEEIKARVAWRKRDESSVDQWLTEYSAQNP